MACDHPNHEVRCITSGDGDTDRHGDTITSGKPRNKNSLPRIINRVGSRKHHSYAVTYQALPLFWLTVKSWEWPGDVTNCIIYNRNTKPSKAS